MPRPGPTPYECVRRAWHSDRHQPMRGSLIQEIFRVANEIHSPATKKNKKWQEKLPIVVLKAEEIMYSKANSEFMDLKMLWDRVNDAINTIIRRDETTEAGEYLQLCIEAAINLGCIQGRAPRSQRHNNSRSYLNPNAQEPTSAIPGVSDNTTYEESLPLQSGNRTNRPQLIPRYSTFSTPIVMNSTSPVTQDSNPTSTHEFLLPFENFSLTGLNQPLPIPDSPPSNLGRVYPLYYGAPLQSRVPQLSFQVQIPQELDGNTVIGVPLLEKIFFFEVGVNASDRITQSEFNDTSEKPFEIECDLSLRLGSLRAVGTGVENELPHQVEDFGSSSSREGSKSTDWYPPMGKEFYFLPGDDPDDPSESCSFKWSPEVKGLNVEAISRKRNAPVSDFAEDGNTRKQPNFPSNQFLDGLKKPGL